MAVGIEAVADAEVVEAGGVGGEVDVAIDHLHGLRLAGLPDYLAELVEDGVGGLKSLPNPWNTGIKRIAAR
ncbi:MAG: hypothetical protein OHK0039_38260 [Bacteroidia bacterium]